MSRATASALIAVVATSALLGTACRRAPAAAEVEAPRLGTVRRLVENGTRVPTDHRLQPGAFKFLGSTGHPTLTGARSLRPFVSCGAFDRAKPREKRPCEVSAPPTVPPTRHAIVERHRDPMTRNLFLHRPIPRAERDDEPHATAPDAQPHDDATAAHPADDATTADADTPDTLETEPGPIPSLLLETGGPPASLGEITQLESTLARAFPAPPLAERTLTTEPFLVPSDAVLRLAVGIEEPAWWIDSAPVQFRVVMIETPGGATQDLFRRVLDPARRPADRRWLDADVDLSDLAGKTVRLRFLSEPLQAGDTRPSLPVWGDPRLLTTVRNTGRPSIVLVSLDTMRAKSMSTYGYELETSPRITALAASGALFENAFTTFSNTLPSHMSMLTGLYPKTHGVFPGRTLRPEHATLAEVLRHAGYATAAFTEDALLDSRRGFRRGFSHYDENTEIKAGGGDAAGTFGRALEWAGRHADEPFFLFVHTYEVHAPYDPEPAYRTLFGTDVPPKQHAQRAYEQEIRQTDDLLQRLLDGLRKVVPADDLLIVVTADHGEEFGEHGMLTHNQLFDEVMHVPLVMVWPGTIPPGLRIATPVSLVDVTPTILDLVDVPAPRRIDGVSLRPLLASPPGTIERDVVLAEFPEITGMVARHFVARSARAKCMLSARGTSEKCFDLERDPGEREPLGPDASPEVARVHAMADGYRRSALGARPGGRPRAPAPHAGPTPAPDDADDDHAPEVDGPVERKLRALGYVE